jgi:hypothetical protein
MNAFYFLKSQLVHGVSGVQYVPVIVIGNEPLLRSRRLSVALILTLTCRFAH